MAIRVGIGELDGFACSNGRESSKTSWLDLFWHILSRTGDMFGGWWRHHEVIIWWEGWNNNLHLWPNGLVRREVIILNQKLLHCRLSMACAHKRSMSLWILLRVIAWHHDTQVICFDLVLLGSTEHARSRSWVVQVTFHGTELLIWRVDQLLTEVVPCGKLWQSLCLQASVVLMCRKLVNKETVGGRNISTGLIWNRNSHLAPWLGSSVLEPDLNRKSTMV